MEAFRLLRKKFQSSRSDSSKASKSNIKSTDVDDGAPSRYCGDVIVSQSSSFSTVTETSSSFSSSSSSTTTTEQKEMKRMHVTAAKAKELEESKRKSSLPEEKLQELQEAFVLFDKNRDGMISKEELGAVLYALGQRPTVLEVQALIRSVDLDKSGTIDFDEFVKIFSAKLSIDPEQELYEVFCIFDNNGDGFISADELYDMLRKLGEHITEPEAHKMIQEADLNKDGKVDYQEFKAILKSR